MADHLLGEGYKDAAAVLIGSTLEQHLRSIADSNNVSTVIEKHGKEVQLKADALNAALAKAGVYSKLDQKSVTHCLGIRNSAAHGNYGDYNNEQVKIFLTSVIEFMARTS